MKLNIYNRNEENKMVIAKTYEANSADIMFGTVEDLIAVIDGIDLEDANSIMKAIRPVLGIVKPLLFDIFDGLTEEELKHTKTKEVMQVFVELVAVMMTELGGFGNDNTKN